MLNVEIHDPNLISENSFQNMDDLEWIILKN